MVVEIWPKKYTYILQGYQRLLRGVLAHRSSGLWCFFISLHICFLFSDVCNFWIPVEQQSEWLRSWNDMKLSLMIECDDNDCEQVKTLCMDKWRLHGPDYDCMISSSENRAHLLFKAAPFSPHPGALAGEVIPSHQGCFGCKVTCKRCNICMSALITPVSHAALFLLLLQPCKMCHIQNSLLVVYIQRWTYVARVQFLMSCPVYLIQGVNLKLTVSWAAEKIKKKDFTLPIF